MHFKPDPRPAAETNVTKFLLDVTLLAYLIKVCFYFNLVYFYEDLLCFKLTTKRKLWITTTEKPQGPAYVINGSNGLYLHYGVH